MKYKQLSGPSRTATRHIHIRTRDVEVKRRGSTTGTDPRSGPALAGMWGMWVWVFEFAVGIRFDSGLAIVERERDLQ